MYLGSQLLAVQDPAARGSGVYWMHEDPVTKSKRVTNSAGTVVSTIETDPWGANTNRSINDAFQPRKFTSYDRDQNGTDEAMFRRYNRQQSRFDQPDPYDGSYDFANPQSFNRYAYVQNDPVNFVDPLGLDHDGGVPHDPWEEGDIEYTDTLDKRPRRGGGVSVGPIVLEDPPTDGPPTGGGGPQDTSQQNPNEFCITANWFVNTPEAKAAFDDLWRRTQQSQKENGGWYFYEQKTNTLIGKGASQGQKFSMPNEQKEFDAQMSQFRQSRQAVIFMFDIHTHPSGNSSPSAGDIYNINSLTKRIASIGAPSGGHAPIGILIHGPGKITLYDANGLVNQFNRLNECL